MRKGFIAVLLSFLISTLLYSSLAQARGGQSADDCPPGTTDPDCKK